MRPSVSQHQEAGQLTVGLAGTVKFQKVTAADQGVHRGVRKCPAELAGLPGGQNPVLSAPQDQRRREGRPEVGLGLRTLPLVMSKVASSSPSTGILMEYGCTCA